MPLPTPTLLSVQGVLSYANQVAQDPAADEQFIAAIRHEFANVLNRQLLPADTPPQTPYMTLASTSAQLAVSAAQVDFQVRFYGDYLTNIEQGLDYAERKLTAVRGGLEAAGRQASILGLVSALHFSFDQDDAPDEEPAVYIRQHHLQTDAPEDQLQDALVRVALRVRDTYFVNFTLSNYETRVLERPIMPGLQAIRVRPWEGRVQDRGLELAVDINNGLEARVARDDPVITDDGIRAATAMLRRIAATAGPAFAESGAVSLEELVEASAGA